MYQNNWNEEVNLLSFKLRLIITFKTKKIKFINRNRGCQTLDSSVKRAVEETQKNSSLNLSSKFGPVSEVQNRAVY